MKYDILFVSPEFGYGGHGNHSLKIVKFLLDVGFSVCTHIVESEKNVNFTHPDLQVVEIVKPFLGFDVFNPFFDFLSSIRLKKNEKPRLIMRVLPPFYLNIPWISNSTIPELVISHGVVYSNSMKNFKPSGKMGIKKKYSLSNIGKIMRESEKIMLKRSKRIVAVSEYTKGNLIEIFNINAEKIQVIPNFVDTSLFKRKKEVTSEIGKKVKEFKNNSLLAVFVFGSYPIPSKNIDLLFNIVIALHNVDLKFIIVGLDENNKYFQHYIRIMKNHKTMFVGYLDNHLLPDVYSLSDFLLITSIDENLPTVLLEAMACGTIPITTKVGGISEVIRNHKNGFLVSHDKRAFIEVITKLVDSNEYFLNKLSQNAQKEVKERFDIEIAKRRYVKLINQLI